MYIYYYKSLNIIFKYILKQLKDRNTYTTMYGTLILTFLDI